MNRDGRVDAVDLNLVIAQVFQLAPCTTGDLNKDGVCSNADLQLAVNAVKTGVCTVSTGDVTVDSVAATATQAIIAFRSPNDSPCEIKVSDDSDFSTLVHDVDPQLFPGADRDNRPGAIVNGDTRVFVAGKRRVARATDGRNYSLALQAFTKHYYRITCGQAQGFGSFQTANIPMGMTYADAPQIDPDRPGQWALPTQMPDRTQRIIDPQTGGLLRRVSLDQERNGANVGGVILSYGAFVRNCANKVQKAPDGTQGFLCTFFNNQATGQLYYIIPATGEVRSLGAIHSAYPYVNDAGTVYTRDESDRVYRATYTGDYREIANPAGTAAFSPPVLYNGVPTAQLMQKFDPSFDATLFKCGPVGADAGKFALTACLRHEQDSYGWIGIFYGGDGRTVDPNCGAGDACPRIVAAMNVTQSRASRWCGLHNVQLIPGYPLVSINYSRLADFSGALGTSAHSATLAAAVSAGDATLTLSGQPSPMSSADRYRQTLAVGDQLSLGRDQQEIARIVSISARDNGQVSLQVTRDVGKNGAKALPAGTPVWPLCSGWGAIGYWRFAEDPHGADSSGATVVNDYFWGYGGHMDNGPLGRVAEANAGWQAVYGNIMEQLNKPVSLYLEDSPTFTGAKGLGYGSTTSKHPSYHQDASQTSAADQRWFLDMTAFDGGNVISDPSRITHISGQLYQYFQAPGYGAELARKRLAVAASTGGESLMDVSGPESVISDQPSDSYKFCTVDVFPGECRPGSKLGDIYINAPNVAFRFCSGGDGPNPANKDLCLGNMNPYYQGLDQLYLSTSGTADATAHSRVITYGLVGLKGGNYYSLAKSLPDGSWSLFTILDPATGNTNVWMAKMPPFERVDQVDRSTFVPAPVQLEAPEDPRITAAVIDFGYVENGDPEQFRCTSRHDVCVATAPKVDPSDPFQWGSAPYSGTPCQTSCMISLPLLPMHTAYYRARYLDASGATVATGKLGVVADALKQ